MTIHLRNIGDGPAQNVTLTFTAATRLEWNKDGLAVDRNERKEQTISKAGERVSSFMRVGDLSECHWTFDADSKQSEAHASPLASVKYSKLRIEYVDSFGDEYVIEHDPGIGGEIVPLRFRWYPPEQLKTPASG